MNTTKATGIIRRIDDLGRVVIPREQRRNLGIREGDPLELFEDHEGIYFKKYNPGTRLAESVKRLGREVNEDLGINEDTRREVVEALRKTEEMLAPNERTHLTMAD